MICCPLDEKLKNEWLNKLKKESESLSDDKITEISNVCKVFSHPLRIRIAFLLNNRDLCVCEIVSILNEKQNLVSHHLSIMKKYGIVVSYNKSKYKFYRMKFDFKIIKEWKFM